MTSLCRIIKHSTLLYNALEHKLPSVIVPVRHLNLQEYQSKQLMSDNGITVQKFKIASSVKDAEEIAHAFHVDEYVVKAQILAGGRGKGIFSSGLQGGVKLTKNPEDVPKLVQQMLGHKLVTKQTPKSGVVVNKLNIYLNED